MPNIEIVAAVIFAIALVHTFSTKIFEWLANRYPRHAGLFHLLGEVKVVLTAITDNAALTYPGSLIDSMSVEAKYMLVAGAVTGGGLTVIANAPNPRWCGVAETRL